EHREDRERMERDERYERRNEERMVNDRPGPTDTTSEELLPLFEDEAARKFRSRWLTIQSKFVDDPRDAVKQADDLVADIIKNVTMSFSDRRVSLEQQWNSGENVSTEDMRVALKRYRSFFERLLSLES
ncbi:MAG TPA: hypothetical protein VGK56_05250, partial [Anaerolineales bacterium]